MSQRVYFLICNFILISCAVFGQSEINQSNTQESVHTLEVNAVLKTGGGIRSVESNDSFSPVFDTIDLVSFTDASYEIQFKYIRKINSVISGYSGLYLGTDFAQNRISFRDSIQPVFGSLFDRGEFEAIGLPNTFTRYISIPLGARLTGNIFKNDKINFSLGAIFTLYPKQENFPTNTFTSNLREEEITIQSNYPLNTSSIFTTGLEVDLNYQLISKKEKFKLIFGFQLLQPRTNLFEFTNTISSTSQVKTVDFEFQRASSAIYIGTFFSLK